MQTVLVIEDEVHMRNSISQVLDFAGYETLVAPDGSKGVEVARQRIPDLIISDLVMPKLDGYGVLKMLRENVQTAMIPVILLTSLPPKNSMRQGMELGADDYIRKPVEADELVAAVNAQIKKRERLAQTQDIKLDALVRNIIHALPHEMHTPLHQIMGFAQLLATDPDSRQAREFASHILDASSRLQHLVENYLVFAQAELIASDPQEAAKLRNHEPVEAEAVLRDVARICADEHDRLDDLCIDTQPGSLPIAQENLTKIVTELIDNAFKFSEAGAPVVVQAACENGCFVIHIRDYGRGMSAEQIKSMGAYMQFDRTLYEQTGVGLGFALARRLVELHDGKIEIHSEPKKGTRVRLSLPLAAAPAVYSIQPETSIDRVKDDHPTERS